MVILVRLISIVMLGAGIIFLLSPKMLKALINFLRLGKRLYVLGILRLLIGAILLLAASQCRLSVVVATLGILVLIKGIFIFIFGLKRMNSMINWWDKRSFLFLRLIGLIALAVGVLLFYSV